MHLLKAHRGVQCFLDWPSDDKDLMPKIKPLKNSSKGEMKFKCNELSSMTTIQSESKIVTVSLEHTEVIFVQYYIMLVRL